VTAVEFAVDGPADAPVVVLSNSLGTSMEMWQPQLTALSACFRVVRYDARGHGRSPVPPGPYSIDDLTDDVVELLDRLDVQQAHLVGLSMGGATVLHVAARYPERVLSLAVLCSGVAFGTREGWQNRAATVRSLGVGAVAAAVVENWFTPVRRDADPDLVRWAIDMLAATPRAGYAACCELLATLDIRADLEAVRAATLLIAGAEDQATSLAAMNVIAAGVPQSRLVIVPGAAHIANVEQPQLVTGELLRHLTEIPD
jgi:3-oxoadipate enol-lactonase